MIVNNHLVKIFLSFERLSQAGAKKSRLIEFMVTFCSRWWRSGQFLRQWTTCLLDLKAARVSTNLRNKAGCRGLVVKALGSGDRISGFKSWPWWSGFFLLVFFIFLFLLSFLHHCVHTHSLSLSLATACWHMHLRVLWLVTIEAKREESHKILAAPSVRRTGYKRDVWGKGGKTI